MVLGVRNDGSHIIGTEVSHKIKNASVYKSVAPPTRSQKLMRKRQMEI